MEPQVHLVVVVVEVVEQQVVVLEMELDLVEIMVVAAEA
jgi:hypothetical protein